MAVAGDLVGAVTGLGGVGDGSQQAVGHPVPQDPHSGDGFCAPGDRLLHGGRHADDAGHVVGATAPVALLTAAVDDGLDSDALPHDEGADALRAPELVGADGDEGGARCERGHVEPREGLHGVGVDDGGRRPVAYQLNHVGERLHGADLVVGEHDGDHRDRLVEQFGEGGEVDDAVGPHRCRARLGQATAGVQDGVVLDRRADDSSRMGAVAPDDGEVVGLGASGGEHDLTRSRTQTFGDDLARLVETLPGFARHRV